MVVPRDEIVVEAYCLFADGVKQHPCPPLDGHLVFFKQWFDVRQPFRRIRWMDDADGLELLMRSIVGVSDRNDRFEMRTKNGNFLSKTCAQAFFHHIQCCLSHRECYVTGFRVQSIENGREERFLRIGFAQTLHGHRSRDDAVV